MSRSLSYLRRGLFGIAFVGSMSFGVTQALAGPATAAASYCIPEDCWEYCQRTNQGAGLCTIDPSTGGKICVCY